MAKMVRCSFTLPPEMKADLAHISSRLGVSQSSLLSTLVAEPLRDVRQVLDAIPPSPTPDDFLRARGVSQDLITARLRGYREGVKDLFDDCDN